MTRAQGREVTPLRSVGYDTLIIAIGGRTNNFDVPSVSAIYAAIER